jgi:hypothetical protein
VGSCLQFADTRAKVASTTPGRSQALNRGGTYEYRPPHAPPCRASRPRGSPPQRPFASALERHRANGTSVPRPKDHSRAKSIRIE